MSFPATLYGAEKDVYETGTFQQYPIGQKLVTPDGSIFRYTEMAGTASVVASLNQAAVPTAGWLSQAATVALAAGDSTITFRPTATALVADELAGGSVLVEETDDLGGYYKIKSNTAANADADSVLTLEDGVTVKVAVAVAGGNVLTVLKSPWKDVVVAPATAPTARTTGISRVVIAANAYGWLQTRGVTSYLVNGTHIIGGSLVPSNAVAGALGRKSVSGTGTIANAETTEVVTHAMGSTPTLDWINFVFGETPTQAITIWNVITLTATQFTITINDPGASGMDLGWSVTSPYAPVGTCVEVAPTADFGHCFLTIE